MLSRLAQDPGVTIAVAIFAGMVVQAIAQHLRVPSIILLLATGVLLGPDAAGLIEPRTLGVWLHRLVGFGVSVILFEGAMNLDIKQLRRQARSIRQLSTVGVLVTAAGAALAARLILGWSMPLAILFGTLVTVTGPTVITPLVRRMRLQSRIATVLQAEGIFVDAIGTIVAVVALEIVLAGEEAVAAGALGVALRLAAGAVFGAVGGLTIVGLLRVDRLIPEGLQRVFTLALVLALFQLANAIISESGILAAVVAGLVVGNTRSHGLGELREFKEELTVLLLGLLFVLLAADVRVAEVQALGWRGFALVAAIMLIVRPLNVWVGTNKTDLTGREKFFLSVVAPRGIVAAAVASLFAQTLEEGGVSGGTSLRAMVFFVIGVTVIVAGTVGTLFARFLGLQRSSSSGYAILGAQPMGRTLAKILKTSGEDVVMIDSNPQLCLAAENEGLRIIYGSGLSESVLQRAELDVRAGCIGVTTNDEVNLLFARRARKVYRVRRSWVSIRSGHLNITPKMVRDLDSHLLFGRPRKLDVWNLRLERAQAELRQWKFAATPSEEGEITMDDETFPYVPLAVQRGRKTVPVDEETTFRRDDVLHVLVWSTSRSAAEERLMAAGFVPAQPVAEEAPAPAYS